MTYIWTWTWMRLMHYIDCMNRKWTSVTLCFPPLIMFIFILINIILLLSTNHISTCLQSDKSYLSLDSDLLVYLSFLGLSYSVNSQPNEDQYLNWAVIAQTSDWAGQPCHSMQELSFWTATVSKVSVFSSIRAMEPVVTRIHFNVSWSERLLFGWIHVGMFHVHAFCSSLKDVFFCKCYDNLPSSMTV